jgi:hypothetical protein
MAVEHGVCRPPNERIHEGNAMNGTVSLGKQAGDMRPPNEHLHAGDPDNGSVSLSRQGTPISPPNHRFNVANAGMSQPPSASEPGKGAVPIEPFTPLGNPSRTTATLRDANRR